MIKIFLTLLYIFILVNPLYAPDFPVNEVCPLSDNKSGLKVLLHLDEGAGTSCRDASGNGNTGTLAQSDHWTTGKFDGAYDFDGVDDFIDEPGLVTDLALDTQGSISIWFNIDSIPGTFSYLVAASRYADNTGPWLAIIFDDRDDRIDCRLIDGIYFWRYRTPAESVDALIGKWTHFVLTQNGVEPKIYINGEFVTPEKLDTTDTTLWFKAVYTDATSKADSFAIGTRKYDGGTGEFFDGPIDDVAVLDRALTAEEIYHIYHEQVQDHR